MNGRAASILAAVLLGLAAIVLTVLGATLADTAAVLGRMITHPVYRTVAAGAAVLGIAGGVLGSFAVLRRQSLLGDAVSHSALPGIYLFFALWSVTGLAGTLVLGRVLPEGRSLGVVLLGALATGLLSAGLVLATAALTRLKEDAALGIFLAGFFGLGVVLRSWLQARPGQFGNRAGLEAFLYGSIATLTPADVLLMAVPTALAVAAVAAVWKEMKLLSFDPDYLHTLGYPVRALEAFVTFLIVGAVVIGLQMVGVVLMSAMLIAPAVAARQWTDRLGPMVAIACLVGVASGLVGIAASGIRAGLSTGPVIAVYATGVALASLAVAPERGLAWRSLRQRHLRRAFATDTLLLHIAQHPLAATGLASTDIARQLEWSAGAVDRALREASAAGSVRRVDGRAFLTAAGESRVSARLAEVGTQRRSDAP